MLGSDLRSTKAGAQTPATLALAPIDPAGIDRRSTKAGAQTPATLGEIHEGRVDHQRSTKAGAQTPATPGVGVAAFIVGSGRSTKAGAQTPATPASWCRSSRPPRPTLNKGRSTNSGDTRRRWRGYPRPTIALNKGRSTNSGDTRGSAPSKTRLTYIAQQRPEHKLRRHVRVALPGTYEITVAQQRPEHKLRRHDPAARLAMQFVHQRSTKAGAQTPATPLYSEFE